MSVAKHQEEDAEDDAGCADVDAHDDAAQGRLAFALARPLFS